MIIRELRPLFTEEAIAARVEALAKEIDATYGDEPLLVVGVLKGAYMFMTDLVRALKHPRVEIDFVRVTSYGDSEKSSLAAVMKKDIELTVEGKHVLLVEDIIDTGHSLRFLYDTFERRRALSLRTAVLLDKKERRMQEVQADFVAFEMDKGFVVGYGLDYAEQYRNLPAVYVAVTEE